MRLRSQSTGAGLRRSKKGSLSQKKDLKNANFSDRTNFLVSTDVIYNAAGEIDHVILKQRDDLTVHTKSVFPSATAEATLYAFGDGRQHRGFALTFPLLTAISRRRGG